MGKIGKGYLMIGVAATALSIVTGDMAFAAASNAADSSKETQLKVADGNSKGQSLVIEEVTVTARKRKENIEKIPVAITAFTSADVEDQGITRMADVAANVPNLILEQSYRAGVINLSMRGHASPQQGDAPIVLNVDGIQEPGQDFINQDLFDIERIEVLKGPQSVLYGAGAIAGAINIITKKPTNDFEGFATAKIGNSNERRYVAGISGPIVQDTLHFRLAAVDERRDGYIRNALTGNFADYFNEYSVRGTLYGDFDKLHIDLRATYTNGKDGASYYEAFPLLPDPVPQIDLLFGGPLGRLGSNTSNATYKNYSGVPTDENRKVFTSSLKIDYDLAGGVLTSVSGFNDSRQVDFGDLDFQPINLLLQDVRYNVRVYNEELRYASDASKRFRWVGGVFYQKRDIYNQVIVDLGDFTTNLYTSQQARNTISGILTDGRDDIHSKQWGVFLSTDYDILDNLTLSVGARYDSVKIETNYAGQNPAWIALAGQPVSETFSKLQPKVNLSYKVTPNTIAYVDVARGFRPGAPNPTAAYAGGLPRFIKAEYNDSVEVGVKNRLWGGRVLLNGDVFYNLIHNRQHYFYGASLQSMTTYDKARVWGLETDLTAILAPGLRLQSSLGLMSAKIASDQITQYFDYTTGAVALQINNKGNTLPDTPTTTFNLSLDDEVPISGDMSLYARAAYRYVSKIYFDTENFINNGGAASYVDLRLGVKGENWHVMGYVDNATDTRRFSNYAYSGGEGNYLPNQPRTYGVELGHKF